MASKRESNFINMVITLFMVSAVAALALGAVYNVTKEPIALAKKKKLEAAIKTVLPEFNDVETVKVGLGDGEDSLVYYIASKDDEVIGTAIKTWTMKGFSGKIEIMVGFLNDGTINNTAVVSHKETPGLGDKMDVAKSDFPLQFMGKNPGSFNVMVKKDGGEVDAITAATITSRAFSDAVQRAYDSYMKQNSNK